MLNDDSIQLSVGTLATIACLMEVTAPKPGNVHRSADFAETSFYDFQMSSVILGQTIDQSSDTSVGNSILNAVKANQWYVGQNTNLGIILLLVPLAHSIRNGTITPDSIANTLSNLNADDAESVFQAIRIASPGGLGKSDQMDVSSQAPSNLLDAMKYAEERDQIARQYTRNFETVFDVVVPTLLQGTSNSLPKCFSEVIVATHVRLLSLFSDSLIRRKCGEEIAKQAQLLAQKSIDILDRPTPNETEELDDWRQCFWTSVADLDFWMRSDHNRRNPGTTADLIAAGLFVMLVNGQLSPANLNF